MRAAEDRPRWRAIGEAYVEQWLMMTMMMKDTPIRTNLHWARVVGCGPFSLLIHKQGLCSSSGDIVRLMMRVLKRYKSVKRK
jgi:hypothetical protein